MGGEGDGLGGRGETGAATACSTEVGESAEGGGGRGEEERADLATLVCLLPCLGGAAHGAGSVIKVGGEEALQGGGGAGTMGEEQEQQGEMHLGQTSVTDCVLHPGDQGFIGDDDRESYHDPLEVDSELVIRLGLPIFVIGIKNRLLCKNLKKFFSSFFENCGQIYFYIFDKLV